MLDLSFPRFARFRTSVYIHGHSFPTYGYNPPAECLALIWAPAAAETHGYSEASPIGMIAALARQVPFTAGEAGTWLVILALLAEWTHARTELGLISRAEETRHLLVYREALAGLDAMCVEATGKPAQPWQRRVQ